MGPYPISLGAISVLVFEDNLTFQLFPLGPDSFSRLRTLLDHVLDDKVNITVLMLIKGN